MKADEIRGKTQDELQKLLLDLKKEQFNLRLQKSQGQLENTARIRVVRRDIARVKTIMAGGVAAAAGKPAAKGKPAAAKKTAAKKAPAKKSGEKAA